MTKETINSLAKNGFVVFPSHIPGFYIFLVKIKCTFTTQYQISLSIFSLNSSLNNLMTSKKLQKIVRLCGKGQKKRKIVRFIIQYCPRLQKSSSCIFQKKIKFAKSLVYHPNRIFLVPSKDST